MAERRIDCRVPPFVVKDAGGRKVEIQPSLGLHKDLLITGTDFIPIRSNGAALVEQAVHTPSLYLGKRRALLDENGVITARIGRVREVAGDSLLVGGMQNYYHWLVDYLPRLLLARRHVDVRPLKVIVNGQLAAFQIDSLKTLGITSEQLVQLDPGESALCASVFVPSLLASTTLPHPVLPQLIKEALKPSGDLSSSKRVYLSRRDAASRQLVNEPALENLLAQFGFEVQVPGQMTFQQQVDLFTGTTTLFAAHGAGMANMLFCPIGGTVVEVYTPKHQVTSMQLLAEACGLRHSFVRARNVTFGAHGNPLLGDWEVDLQEVEATLSKLFHPSG